MTTDVAHAGDPRHPDHDRFIHTLGRATWHASYLAGGMFDLLRVHLGLDYWELTQDTHGRLRARLEARAERLPGLAAAVPLLAEAVSTRNALVHAIPVADGLQYRTKEGSVVNFYDVSDLDAAAALFSKASATVNRVLYHDGGEAVRRYSGA